MFLLATDGTHATAETRPLQGGAHITDKRSLFEGRPVRDATVRRIMETAYLFGNVIMATTTRKTAYYST